MKKRESLIRLHGHGRFIKRSTNKFEDDLRFQLSAYKDLYTQACESRDFWKNKESWAVDLIKVAQNKLRDEQELCDQLSDHLKHMVENHNTLVPSDITRGRLLLKVYKEARNGK